MSAVEEPLSPERLEEIRARAEAATAGPWWVYEEEVCAEIVSEETWIARNDGPDGQDLARVNAKFIAAARTDVPLLVAEVGWLAAELADAQAESERLRRLVAELERQVAAEIRRTSAAVGQVHRLACGCSSDDLCKDCGRCCSCRCASGGAL